MCVFAFLLVYSSLQASHSASNFFAPYFIIDNVLCYASAVVVTLIFAMYSDAAVVYYLLLPLLLVSLYFLFPPAFLP